MEKGDWRGALNKYYDIIENDDNLKYRKISVKRIFQINNEHNLSYSDIRETISKELETAQSWYKASLDFLKCETYVNEDKIDDAISAFTKNADKYKGTSMEVESLSRLAIIYADYKKDKTRALELANNAASINPGQEVLFTTFASADMKYDPSLYTDKFEGVTENFDDLSEPEEENLAEGTTEFLSQNPNPFNPATTLTYSLAQPTHVTLEVYAITGQKIDTLVDGIMSEGQHSARFDGRGLASGIYIYRFDADGVQKTGRMVLVK
ncbi:T9SS type A sorting domain-containing protein [Candidatus Latescibacterota bacterium]